MQNSNHSPFKGVPLLFLLVTPIFVLILIDYFMALLANKLVVFCFLFIFIGATIWLISIKLTGKYSLYNFSIGVLYYCLLCLTSVFMEFMYYCDNVSIYLVENFSPSERITELEGQIDFLSDISFFLSTSTISLLTTRLISSTIGKIFMRTKKA